MWEIEVAPGQVHRLNGTVQEVHAQILKINPHFKLKNAPPETSPVLEQDGGLAKRSTVNCGTWPTCSTYRIRQGVQYLHTIGGKPYQRPGPGACSRASCSYNSAIWWCSDVCSPSPSSVSYSCAYSLNPPPPPRETNRIEPNLEYLHCGISTTMPST